MARPFGNYLLLIYFPRWFHQVRSHTDNKRNMAVNVWFHHLPLINETECLKTPEDNNNKFRTYDGINIGKSIEGAK